MSTNPKQAAVELRKKTVIAGLWPCCLNCEHWEKVDGKVVRFECARYKMTPPAETIVVGCQHHLSYIPF